MNGFLQKHWFKLVAVLAVLVIGGAIGYKTLVKTGSPYAVQQKAPGFQLQDASGKTVALADTNEKVRLVYFFWASCPDVCSPTTYILSQVQDRLKEQGAFGSKTSIVSITFDPVRDTPEKLKEFAAAFHADPTGWSFLRGEEQATQDLAQKYGIGIVKDKNGNYTHSNAIFLVDGKGNIRHYYAGADTDLSIDQIVKDVMVMTKEL